jgi:long-chain acyl-CoA synthetase
VAGQKWGEVPVAFVVLKPGMAARPDDLAGFLGARLSKIKAPKRFHIIDEMPRNAYGKVLKNELRARLGNVGTG